MSEVFCKILERVELVLDLVLLALVFMVCAYGSEINGMQSGSAVDSLRIRSQQCRRTDNFDGT